MDRYTEYANLMTKRRHERTAMYAGLVLSGVFTALYPSTVVTDQVGTVVTYFWSAAMISSAVTCTYGSFTDKWIGEFSGIPLLAAVLAFYSGALFLSIRENGNLLVVAFAFILLSFSFGLIARWQDVRSVKREAVSQGNEDERGTL